MALIGRDTGLRANGPDTIVRCSRCVMDTTDPQITFDEDGVCDHCRNHDVNIRPFFEASEERREELKAVAAEIRRAGRKDRFDCILGLSGGMDSSYLLHVAVREMGLRPLVFHVDGGWNSETAVHNIEVMVDKLGLELFTKVVQWGEMRDLQLAFFRSGVSHLDVPQDHAFIATLYQFATRHDIKFILNGGNFATEGVRNPMEWLYYGSDLRQLRDIHSTFGERPLEDYPMSNVLWHKIYLRYVRGVQVVKPLNLICYRKREAEELLASVYGWQGYPRKHFESRFTKFFESFWLPTRFGYDTRKPQYSSLILSDQMDRAEALEELETPGFDPEEMDEEFKYVAMKLGVSCEELEKCFRMPRRSHRDFKNQEWLFRAGAWALHFLGVERSIKR